MKSASLLTRTIDSGRAAVQRLRDVLWPIAEAAAAGMAWYIAHNALGHPDPFFAPIAAAVCVSASNVFQAQRALQNISGVALGITLGAVVRMLFGNEWAAMAAAVFVALCAAVLIGYGLIGQGLTFANQTAGSAILVMALSGGDRLFERLQEALIGGGVAVVLSVLLFPANPMTALRTARLRVLGALHEVLAEIADRADGGMAATPEWQYAAFDRVHRRLGELLEARSNARHLVRIAPWRWAARQAVEGADRQAAHVALLAGSVLQLARAVATTVAAGCRPSRSVHDAIDELAAAVAATEASPDAASARAVAACEGAGAPGAGDGTDLGLANAAQACAGDLREVICLGRRS